MSTKNNLISKIKPMSHISSNELYLIKRKNIFDSMELGKSKKFVQSFRSNLIMLQIFAEKAKKRRNRTKDTIQSEDFKCLRFYLFFYRGNYFFLSTQTLCRIF